MKSISVRARLVWVAAIAAIGLGIFATVEADEAGARSGKFSVLTYNVAGLPEGISSSHPYAYQPLISPLLNDFDLALCQEDFCYHRRLASQASHPYQALPGTGGTLGDGLSFFSRFPLSPAVHVAWQECYGTLGHANDCLTPKGYAYVTAELAPGVFLDIYNLHMDAGNSDGDIAAKTVQVAQLIAAIREHSAGKAVLVAGDTNLTRKRPVRAALIDQLLSEASLTDACAALSCGEDRIDRIMFRGSPQLKLTPLSYQVESKKFVNPLGLPLSDHKAVSVVFEWERIGE